ncbi:MAG: hypothetical protein QM784_22650 [Polyangiaceae bacterium]
MRGAREIEPEGDQATAQAKLAAELEAVEGSQGGALRGADPLDVGDVLRGDAVTHLVQHPAGDRLAKFPFLVGDAARFARDGARELGVAWRKGAPGRAAIAEARVGDGLSRGIEGDVAPARIDGPHGRARIAQGRGGAVLDREGQVPIDVKVQLSDVVLAAVTAQGAHVGGVKELVEGRAHEGRQTRRGERREARARGLRGLAELRREAIEAMDRACQTAEAFDEHDVPAGELR